MTDRANVALKNEDRAVVIGDRRASMSDEHHSYTPLDYKKQQIRLLLLKPAPDPSEPVSCELYVCDLAGNPSYVALSYTWGSFEYTGVLMVNGKARNTTKNLLDFFQAFRNNAANINLLWIDQICIDRSNTQERNHQVQMMGEIYSRSTYVMVWLGIGSEDAAQTFLDTSRSEYDDEILQNPYWSRVWTVQEILVAQEVRILCGLVWLSFRSLSSAIDRRNKLGRRPPNLPKFLSGLSGYQQEIRERGSLRLRDCLELNSQSCTTDPRDRVYGILGLVSETRHLSVDYSKTVSDVFLDAILALAKHYVQQAPALSIEHEKILAHLAYMGRSMGLEYPFQVEQKIQEVFEHEVAMLDDSDSPKRDLALKVDQAQATPSHSQESYLMPGDGFTKKNSVAYIKDIPSSTADNAARTTRIGVTSSLRLPPYLQEVIATVPKGLITISSGNCHSGLNSMKLFLEEYTGYRWDWYPLQPSLRHVKAQNRRVQWKLYSRCLQYEAPETTAVALNDALALADDHPAQCHCCSLSPYRAQYLDVLFRFKEIFLSELHDVIHYAKNEMVSSTAAQRYTPATQASSSSTATLVSQTSSLDSPCPHSGTHAICQTQDTNLTLTSTQGTNHWILFAVKGWRWSLELEQIFVPSNPCDSAFFRTLRDLHRVHRGTFLHWCSPFRFVNCKSVKNPPYLITKFQQLDVNRVISNSEPDLPDFHKGQAELYDYAPRPPETKLPLIDPEYFQILLNECTERCLWTILPWHDCIRLPPKSSCVGMIPKRKENFHIEQDTNESIPFGIRADYVLSLGYLFFYHLVTVVPAFVFWAWWIARNPGDWQTASVPLATTLALITVIWIMAGKRMGIH